MLFQLLYTPIYSLPLIVDHGQYDHSIDLAERYHDFSLLVRLCESAGDRERLKSYVVRFSEQGFAEFLFKRHLDLGKLAVCSSNSLYSFSMCSSHIHYPKRVCVCLRVKYWIKVHLSTVVWVTGYTVYRYV